MKKIVALVLSLVMVLGLATTAFGITLWAPNGSTADCDVFEANYNTKLNAQTSPVKVTFTPGTALEFNADGSVKTTGVIGHYNMTGGYTVDVKVAVADLVVESKKASGSTPAQYKWADAAFEAVFGANPAGVAFPFVYSVDGEAVKAAFVKATGVADVTKAFSDDGKVLKKTVTATVSAVVGGWNFVLVDSIPADATAAEVADYVLVKTHDKTALQGKAMVYGQTAADAYYILKAVDAITYQTTAEEFTAWSNDCEAYKAPANAATVDYYTVANKTALLTSTLVKYAEAAVTSDAKPALNALVGDEVVTLDAKAVVAATQHTWVASNWDAKKVVTEYTCANCGVVGTVINSPVNAPAGAKIDRLPNGTLVAYTFPVVEAPVVDTEKVESAETFDAGIAMYVGMSVMAAAGSAVVLKKKD